MPSNDWGWYFAAENTRTNALRDEVESLQQMAASASAQSSRLDSQLRRLQGSIETRLAALSVAFDAYVELGDVREQLAAFPDTSAVRRGALRALDALGAGGHPAPLESDDDGYWLVDATNEVIELVASGSPSSTPAGETPEGTAQDGPERAVFVVTALGWLGRGAQVQDRVAPLLAGDGALAPPQIVLWRAVVHGIYGADVLAAVLAVWQSDLDLTGATWNAWARDQARGSGPVDTLRWIRDLLLGTLEIPEDPGIVTSSPDADRAALRLLADARVGAGMGDERELLVRARALRDRIENPGAVAPDPDQEPPRVPTTTLVQEALVDGAVDPDLHRALLGWVRPGLQAAAAEIAAAVASDDPGPTVVHTEAGDVAVGPGGADPDRLAEVDAVVVARFANARSRLLVPSIAAGVLLVAGLALQPTGYAGLGVLLLVVAVVAGFFTVRALLAVRSNRTGLAAARDRTRLRLEEGRTTAVAVRQASSETKAEAAGLARAVADAGAVLR